jgi:signal transduction histidine kinase/ligand-binding sensor domain-containing protein
MLAAHRERSMTFGQPTIGLVLLLAVPGVARAAQRPAQPGAASFVVRQWDTRSGLPQNSVNDIAQTPDGYLWLATFGGLVRFDGVRFTTFSSRDHPGIGSDRALQLAVDSAGALWVGTENGLIRYAGGVFTTFTVRDGLPQNQVEGLYTDAGGTLWIRAGDHLLRVPSGTTAFTPVEIPPGQAVEVAEDDAGRLWVRHTAGLLRLEPSTGRLVPDSTILPPREIGPLIGRDREGGLWFVSRGRLVRWARGARTRLGAETGLQGQFSSIALAGDGTLWVVSQETGVWRLDPRGSTRARRVALPAGDSTFGALVVRVDREGAVWVGTYVDGLLGIRPRIFTTFPLVQRRRVSTTAILGDRAGRIWIGANCDAVNVIEQGRLRVHDLRPDSALDCVWSLALDSAGGVWFGTWGNGLHRMANGTFELVTASGALTDRLIMALHATRDGDLWVGTRNTGLFRLRNGQLLAHHDTARGMPHPHVNVIAEAPTGELWIGTVGGLVRLEGARLTTYSTANGLVHDNVRALLFDPDGTLWIGTYGGGVNRLREGRFSAITSAVGLFDDQISAIVPDDRGSLWFSSNRGIFRVTRRDLEAVADGRAGTVHSIVYGEPDGLDVLETNGGFQPSAWRAPDGRVWFPTIRGVAVLDPGAVRPNPVPPIVRIEQLVVDGRPVPVAPEVRIPAGSGNVEVVYTGLSSPAPEAVSFRYRLRGVDRDWVYVGGRRIAYYTHLGPGGYTFAVSAANRDGVWSDEGASLRMVIRPPLHATWWFRLLAAGVVGAAIAGLARLRLAERARVAEQAFARRLLESQEAERKRIASELHDTIGQDLLVVKNRAELALRSGAAEAAREQLTHISAIVSETLRHTREIAHNLRPAQLDRLGLATAVRSAVEQAASASGIAFTVETGAVDGVLAPEAEIGVFRIVQEGVSNILKHAEATQAEVALRRDNGGVRLVIRDNGRGFAAERATRPGIGITNIAERVKLMGGSLEVRGAPGTGVSLTIRIPGAAGGRG